jgi:hypothetical protein
MQPQTCFFDVIELVRQE